jgi:hypothetical protein
MTKFNSKDYYVKLDFLTRGDAELSKVVKVSKEIFQQLKPYEDQLGRGAPPEECDEAIAIVLDGEDADLRPSQIENIPDEHFIYIAVC